jgi:hypothetical protein
VISFPLALPPILLIPQSLHYFYTTTLIILLQQPFVHNAKDPDISVLSTCMFYQEANPPSVVKGTDKPLRELNKYKVCEEGRRVLFFSLSSIAQQIELNREEEQLTNLFGCFMPLVHFSVVPKEQTELCSNRLREAESSLRRAVVQVITNLCTLEIEA